MPPKHLTTLFYPVLTGAVSSIDSELMAEIVDIDMVEKTQMVKI